MKKTFYVIRVTDNSGNRHDLAKEYPTKADAGVYLKKLLSKPKMNCRIKGKPIYQTAYRNALTGFGINNPRIVKRSGSR